MLREAPAALTLGLGILAAGAVLDLGYHLAPSWWLPFIEEWLGKDGRTAHLVTLVGMVVTLMGVVMGRRAGGPRARRG